jgi:hypothetical protein
MPFVPDQLVVCVDDRPSSFNGAAFPAKRGSVYTVETAFIHPSGADGITLMEVGIPPPHVGFFASRFRPIDDKALDIFRQVLTDAPMDEETV